MALATYTTVIPTGGTRASLARAVESALTQSLEPLEIIVICTDLEKRSVVESILRDIGDDRVRVDAVDARGYANAARWRGVMDSSAEYVAFLDDDDWWSPRKLETQLEFAATCALDVVATAAQIISLNGDRRWPLYAPILGSGFASYLFRRRSLGAGWSYLPTPSLLVRRDFLLAHPLKTDLRRHQDWAWLLSLDRDPDVRFGYVDEALTYVDMRGPSVSRSQQTEYSAAWVKSVRLSLTPREFGDAYVLTVLRERLDNGEIAATVSDLRMLVATGASLSGYSWAYVALRVAQKVGSLMRSKVV